MPSEAQARITINKMLEDAGWRFLPDAQGRRENIVCEHRVTRRAFSPSQDLGKDFEHATQGFVDYVHLHDDQRPVAVTEAKREDIDPLTGTEQARSYAISLDVWHIFLRACLKTHELDAKRASMRRIMARYTMVSPVCAWRS